ncbi:MAG: hypothetical protein K9L17_01070 [Clostridiales bacterium]|nr:hypothetical protein [Clostridiales bacterium]MCF8021284.1 hypothetical protein [Clostridiales bacterium]
MQKVQINIELKSPLLLGSGEGWGSLIDTDIVFDRYGLPYFPARRLKGLMRESAIEIIEILRHHVEGFTQTSINQIFGTGTNPGQIKFHNAFLKEYDNTIEWLKWAFEEYSNILSAETVLDTMTEVRMQTAVKNDGTAENASLRSQRVLTPEHKFIAQVHIIEENQHAFKLLALACANLRHIGSKRNRGYGEVECSLWENNKNITNSTIEQIKEGV